METLTKAERKQDIIDHLNSHLAEKGVQSERAAEHGWYYDHSHNERLKAAVGELVMKL